MDSPNTSPEDDTSPNLNFKVSAGLKSVIGRDLITDDEVAIFELVKNSFDANATTVTICFINKNIYLIDNGDGMSLDDIKSRWLFVAYSNKKNTTSKTDNFREQISERTHYAGSKGIGRFSSDRLGSGLVMQTRARNAADGPVHKITVDWKLFEDSDEKNFSTIPVNYEENKSFSLPDNTTAIYHGTVVEITNTRTEWERSRILHLKSSLAKLINPFGSDTDNFQIEVISEEHLAQDTKLIAEASNKQETVNNSLIVNSIVGNFIFSQLREKTTFLEVSLSESGEHITSCLTDRGELVYKIREPNPFQELKTSGVRCQLYYLNQSAKLTFARRMGLPSVQFGSVFLFRNGFRVFPIGEEGNDWYGIDRRKQQGYARFLGSRDVIGRLDVSGSEDLFKEASSRNQGLIESAASQALKEFFWENCLKRLERYVVPVTWADPGEKQSEDLSRLLTDSGRARVAASVAKLVDNPNIEIIEYSRTLINILNERSSQFEDSIASLRAIAIKTSDPLLLSSLEKAEKRFDDLKAAELEAKRIAQEERLAKEAAQRQVQIAEAQTKKAVDTLVEEKKRTLFLTSLTSLNSDTIINMHHQITIYSADLKQQIENCISAARAEELTTADLVSRLEQITFVNQKILSISRLATKANFRLESDTIEADLASFIDQYIKEGAIPFLGSGLKLNVVNNAELNKRFRPMEISIFIDNLISNSRKAGATEINFQISQNDKKSITVRVADNGTGIPDNIDNPESLFELGVSRTSGSGIGLYHVRQVLGEMNGSITLTESSKNGTTFTVRITI